MVGCVCISGCKKDSNTNLTSNWTGVYVNPNSVGGYSNDVSLNNIIINNVNANTLKVEIKALQTSYIYQLTTLQSVSLNSTTPTVATIDEVEGITNYTGKYHIKGTLTITGTHVVLSASATPNDAETSTKEGGGMNLYFSGDRAQ